MAQVKYARLNVPATGAGATSADVNVTTPDDSKLRRVTGFQNSNTTKLIRTVLKKVGNPMNDIDNSILGRFTDFAQCDVSYEPGVQVSFDIINASAGAIAANAENIVVRYEV
jgi:hypothetical protein